MILRPFYETMTHPVSRRIATVERDLRERGFDIESNDGVIIARGDSIAPGPVEAPLSVISLTDGRPLSVVSAVANAAHRGQVPVLVTDPHTRSSVREILSAPFAIANDTTGRRRFYSIEDRIRLTDDTLACVDTYGDLQWTEGTRAAETDSPSVQLTAGEEIVAVLDSVDSLACPGPQPDAFPTRYTRSQGRFRVFDGDGEIAHYGTLSSMRTDGYRPVPLPLVPEHHIRESPSLARRTLIADVDSGTVTYRTIE